MNINDTSKRVIKSVQYDVIAELPIAKAILDNAPEPPEDEDPDDDDDPEIDYYTLVKIIMEALTGTDFCIGSVSGTINTGSSGFADYQAWMNDPNSTWELPEFEPKWYAVKDAEGNLHVAELDAPGSTIIMATYKTDPEEISYDRIAGLHFVDGQLVGVYLKTETGQYSYVAPSTLESDLIITPCHVEPFFTIDLCLPISEPFILNSTNNQDITLEYTDIDNISDIADTTGDDNCLTIKTSMVDIYGSKLDLTDKANNPEGEITSIRYAEIAPAVYDGEEHLPVVTVKGKVLTEGVDYNLYRDESVVLDHAGEYVFGLEGIGAYSGFTFKSYIIQGYLGDVDGNGTVDTVDTTLIRRHDAMMTELYDYQIKLADVDGDEEATILDATWIQRYNAGMKAPEGIGVTIVT